MIYVDKSKCIGCGLCTTVCPAVFYMGGEGFSEVVEGQEESGDFGVQEAIDSCPTQAISA